jgi:hypothetical protein
MVTRPAIADAESGIRGWYVRVAADRPTVVEGEGWVAMSDTISTDVRVAGIPYEQPVYVAIAARSGAGAFSAPVSHALPIRLPDASPAPAPAFCLTGDAGRVAVRLSQVSRDPESGIVGYQVRLRTQAGAVLREWPQGAAVDIPASAEVGAVTPVAGVAMPATAQLVAELRAVNGGGVGGNQAASGPLLVDGTAPPTPTITAVTTPATTKTGALQFRLSVTASADPESGFGGLEVRVDSDTLQNGKTMGATAVVPWTAIPGAVVGSGTYSIGLPATIAGTQRVLVRARNGTGMYSLTATSFLVVNMHVIGGAQ